MRYGEGETKVYAEFWEMEKVFLKNWHKGYKKFKILWLSVDILI